MGPGSGTIYLGGRLGLIALEEFVNDGNGTATSGVSFILVADPGGKVDGSGLKPIGYRGDTPFDESFQGIFDGANVLIENLNVTPFKLGAIDQDGVGLFGMTIGATIENVTISGVTIDVNVEHVGSLVGFADNGTTISGVRIFGSIDIIGQYKVGGLVGTNDKSTITNSHLEETAIKIEGDDELGSFVGYNYSGLISYSSITASLVTIIGMDEFAYGGFVGYNDNGSTITNITFSATSISVSGADLVGGFVGYNQNSHILNTFVYISGILDINGGSDLGGFVGYNQNSNISSSSLNAFGISISGGSDGGGFVGGNIGSLITNSYVNVVEQLEINGISKNNLGGFVGYNNRSTITNSYVSVLNQIEINGGDRLGGFAGRNDEATISNSYINSKEITIDGIKRIGGFVGDNQGENFLSNIVNSYLSSDKLSLSGTDEIGFFVGRNRHEYTVIESVFVASKENLINDDLSYNFVGLNALDASIFNSFFNSGITSGVFLEYTNPQLSSGSGLQDINAVTLSGIINGSGAFEYTGSPDEKFFPILKGLANQTPVEIYWLAAPPSEDPTPPAPSTGSSTPVFRNPSVGETYTYDPVFLTIEVSNSTIEVGETFTLDYRGFSTFGPIIRDYTDDVVVTGTVNPNVLGSYTLTLSLSAEGLSTSKQVTITVVDTTPPVISGPSDIRLFVNEVYESQLTVTDNVDTNVSLTLLTELDTSSAKTEEVIWQATDSSGNTSTFTQSVTIVVPELRIETVVVGAQRFIFPVSEAEFDFTNLTVEYVVSATEPSASSNWQVYTNEPNLNPGERVFIRLSDGKNTSDIRQTIPRPQDVVITEPVVTPEVEATSNNAGLIALGSVVGLAAAGAGWWFLLGKKKFRNE